MHEKYGVVVAHAAEKIAAKSGRPCPSCGNTKVNYSGSTPHCPTCGTQPWEQRPDGTNQNFRR